MPVVSAFLVHGNPLPLLQPKNPPWKRLHAGYRAAAKALADSKPDVIAVYSTQWIAVLDQLWQTRARSKGVHVDENWHDQGDLKFDIRADVELTNAVIRATPAFGVRSKPVDYDGFPIDTGTIVASRYLNPRGELPFVIASNNVYQARVHRGALRRQARASCGAGGSGRALGQHHPRGDRRGDGPHRLRIR